MMDECKLPPSYDECVQTAFCPSAPSINKGFQEDEGFEEPPTAPPFEVSTHERLPIVNLGSLSDEDVREACLQYAAEHCCYGKRFAREMVLYSMCNTHTYHYKLESYGEKRLTAPRFEPFRGQHIDGPENGPSPDAWKISVTSPNLFVDHQAKVEVPHSAYVKQCSRCVGNCRISCGSCSGMGGGSCFSCGGSGRSNDESCSSCSGTGHQRCFRCLGTGQVECDRCDGYGKLKHFKLLIVTWKNHALDFVSDTLNLPKHLILQVSGREILKEQDPRVVPINHAPDSTVNQASSEFISHHQTFPQELVIMQRQTLRAVPLTKVNYMWKNKTGECYVFGFQKKVYFENYPQKCCCCTCM